MTMLPPMADTDIASLSDAQAQAFHDAGYRTFGIYERNLSQSLADTIWRHGMELVVIGEGSATASLGGYQRGHDDMTRWITGARAKVNQPTNRPILATTDDPDATFAQVEPYYTGAKDAAVHLGQMVGGGYGPKDTMRQLHAVGLITVVWGVQQWKATDSDDGLSGAQMYPPRTIAGVLYDHSDVWADMGGWNPHAQPSPSPSTGGFLVDLSPAQQADAYAKIQSTAVEVAAILAILKGDKPNLGDTQQRELASLARIEVDLKPKT